MSQHANLLGAAWVGVDDLSHGIMAVSRVDTEAVALAANARQAAGECTALAARLCINHACSEGLLSNSGCSAAVGVACGCGGCSAI